MATKQELGCDDPRSPNDPQLIERAIVQCFMPILYFAAGEHLFPVDLKSAIRASSLWLADPQTKQLPSTPEKQFGSIDPVAELPNATVNHFTTVAGFKTTWKEVPPQPPFLMVTPSLDTVYQKYSDGTIGAQLTIYATVCLASHVPNAHLFKNAQLACKDVGRALQEGVIINYYMYFPACDSPELQSEGDWSGISLLLPERPTLTQAQNLDNPEILSRFLPVVTAYYRKTIDGAPTSPYFVACNGGFRRWQDVQKIADRPNGPETHPIVYVSQGRHNCYYQPFSGPISLGPPWCGFTADGIENGKYAPGPADGGTLQGSSDPSVTIPLEILFPWLFFFHMSASGCEYPVHFDTSGIDFGHVDGNDRTASGTAPGDKTVPAAAGDPYPSTGRWPGGGPPPKPLGLKLEYVDLLNDAEMAASWRYTGAWGAATKKSATDSSDPQHPHEWGYLRGVRRPALAAWFLWNLFLDRPFGCGGKASVTAVP